MSPIHRNRRAVVPLLLGLVLSLGACHRDEGPERLARAEAKYADLVERGINPSDPAWDVVIAELESVPQDSKARPEAERRLKLLRERRSIPLPPRPLSRPDEPDGGSPSLDEHGHPMDGHGHPR
ncbi:hypothetical protein [Vitiosangium sp. GDMCC 1.1324]|uniref:hypothetical protein n=1 Tax=Vitiosangium sp. (strain GDMCC 1.1324) TaxID=2138576 RepID=UPI000D332AC0|nr:hypothetical protein [Vitiosangium sp. GDMCC 1.1324]PTL81404.1 hypothetical protein DAT35_25210 [Vitiosangium sp. GDMCC 1.1324]